VRTDIGWKHPWSDPRGRRSGAVALALGVAASVALGAAAAAPATAAGLAAPGALLLRERPPCKSFITGPSGQLLPCESTRVSTLVIRTPSGRLLHRYRIRRYVTAEAATMSPDQRSIAVFASKGWATPRGLLLIRVSDAKKRWLVRPRRSLGYRSPAWSPDSTKVLYERSGPEQWVVDVRTGADARVPFPPLANRTTYPLFLPKGDILFSALPEPQTGYFGNPLQLFRLPLNGTPATAVSPEFEHQPVAADISPDGRSIAFVSSSHRSQSPVWVVPIGGGDPQVIAQGPGEFNGGAIRWSPDGTRLAIRWDAPPPKTSTPFTPRSRGELVGLDGARTPLPLPPTADTDRFAWSPDSRYVMYATPVTRPGPSGHGSRLVAVTTTGRLRHIDLPRSDDSPQWLPRRPAR